MNQLAKALEDKFDSSSAIGRMVDISKSRPRRRILPNVRKRKPKNITTVKHEQYILHTLRNGYGIMNPCSVIKMPSGTNVLAHGHKGVIKWALASPPKGKVSISVVLFDEPQTIKGKFDVKSRWAMVESEFVEKIKW